MREAVFIESLNVKRILAGEFHSYQTVGLPESLVFAADGTALKPLEDIKVDIHRVPIHRFDNTSWPKPTYIAWSNEVQHLLGMPFDALKDRAEIAEKSLQKMREELKEFNSLPWYKRVWVAIKGNTHQ